MLFFVWFFVLLNLAIICHGKNYGSNDERPFPGHPVEIGDFKYAVIVMALPCKRCGGSIISENHILTAAHCVDCTSKENIIVMAGKILSYESTGIYRKIEDVHIHPEYNRGIQNPSCTMECYMWLSQWYNGPVQLQRQSANDIAILKVTEPMTLEGNIGKVKLPQPSSPSLDDSCSLCFVTMWQMMKEDEWRYYKLFWARFKILSDEECKQLNSVYRDTEFCAMDITKKTAIVKGHSGGALVCNGIIVGIVSMSKLEASRPAIFQNVSSFRGFIDETMALGRNS